MMKKSIKDVVAAWLEKGNHDLKTADIILKSNDEDVMDMACYHCHQAAEKFLKGFLVSKNISFSKTHDLYLLLELCVKAELAFNGIEKEIQRLSSYDSGVRYPEEALYSLEDAKQALAVAQAIAKFVRTQCISV